MICFEKKIMKMANKLMIYGAYGYTGKLIVHEALCCRLKPIIAGRSQAKSLPLTQDTA